MGYKWINSIERLFKTIFLVIACSLILPNLLLAKQLKVIRIVDGDTIVVDYKGKYEKLRLREVNKALID